MQRCPNCKVNIAGDKVCCPLCHGSLIGCAEPQTEVFPYIKKPRFKPNFVLRLLALIAIIISTICVFINTQFAPHIWWSLFVIAGAVCVWIACAISIIYRNDIAQNIGWQVILIPVLSVFWDYATNWKGWSIDFVLPCVCITGMITLLVIALFFKIKVQTFVFTLIRTCFVGLIPLVLYILGKIDIIYPSFICSGISIIIISWLLLFRFKTMISEINRRFHI